MTPRSQDRTIDDNNAGIPWLTFMIRIKRLIVPSLLVAAFMLPVFLSFLTASWIAISIALAFGAVFGGGIYGTIALIFDAFFNNPRTAERYADPVFSGGLGAIVAATCGLAFPIVIGVAFLAACAYTALLYCFDRIACCSVQLGDTHLGVTKSDYNTEDTDPSDPSRMTSVWDLFRKSLPTPPTSPSIAHPFLASSPRSPALMFSGVQPLGTNSSEQSPSLKPTTSPTDSTDAAIGSATSTSSDSSNSIASSPYLN